MFHAIGNVELFTSELQLLTEPQLAKKKDYLLASNLNLVDPVKCVGGVQVQKFVDNYTHHTLAVRLDRVCTEGVFSSFKVLYWYDNRNAQIYSTLNMGSAL